MLKFNYNIPISETIKNNEEFVIAGIAINETTTSNNHKFIAEELRKAAPSLVGVPLLVDHENKVENLKGRVFFADFDENNKNIPFKAKVNDKACQELISDGRLNSVSVGAIVENVENSEGELIPRGITFKELSLVAVPADSGATFSIALKEAYDLSVKEAVDETEDYYRIRQNDPDKYERFITKDLGKGVKAVIGFKKGGGSEVQSFLFDKDKFTKAEAEAWVKSHKESGEVDITETELEFTDGSDKEMLRLAEASEYSAINLYEDMFKKTNNAMFKEALTHVISQEKEHVNEFHEVLEKLDPEQEQEEEEEKNKLDIKESQSSQEEIKLKGGKTMSEIDLKPILDKLESFESKFNEQSTKISELALKLEVSEKKAKEAGDGEPDADDEPEEAYKCEKCGWKSAKKVTECEKCGGKMAKMSEEAEENDISESVGDTIQEGYKSFTLVRKYR